MLALPRRRPRARVQHRRRARAVQGPFSDEELTTFCYDNFRPTYEEFATGMSRTGKVQWLVERCVVAARWTSYWRGWSSANPYQYDRFRDRLVN